MTNFSPLTGPESLHAALGGLQSRIEKARAASALARPVTLMGASKGQDASKIEQAIRAGLKACGENRVQEAAEKWPALKEAYPEVALHLIGPLQSNKAKQALELFDVIQTLDRVSLADELAKHQGKGRCKAFYIQVNTGKEPQKAGIEPAVADEFISYCRKRGLPVIGLMCVPPEDQPPAPHFALLREIGLRHGLIELSMGMSEDFETAIRMGSTCVRIGRALFGERT